MSYKDLISLSVIVLAIGGCSLVERLSPATIPTELTTYVQVNPNDIKWSCIGKLEDLRGIAINKNVNTQLDYKALMDKDEANFKLAIEQANLNLTAAKAEWDLAVGTLNNSGWVISALIGAGGLIGGKLMTQLTHYSESEVAQIKKDMVNNGSVKV